MAVLFSAVFPLAAEQRELSTENTIDKVDAILLLDASGSMRTTDPLRLRDEGAKLFIQFLKPGDRLGIIEFSETVKTIRPLSEYSSEQSAQISSDLQKVGNSGTYTDLLSALKTAHRELKAQAREDAHPIVVVLSDGKIDPDPAVASAALQGAELANVELPGLKADGIRVHTLSFSDQADKEMLSQIALGSDGVNWFTPTAEKIHESYADLFLVVKKPQIVPLAGKAFVIDEDIDEATFYINREEGATVTLESPEKTSYTAASTDDGIKWYSGTRFDVITLKEPKAGKWKVTGLTNADGFATVLTDLKLITEWPSSFSAKDPILLQARLYEEKKPVSLPQMTGVVKYGFQITPTDRVSEPVIRSFLVDDGSEGDKISEDGIYSKRVIIDEPGEYKLTIVAKGPTFTRHQQVPFRVKPRMITLRVAQGGAAHAGAAHGAAGAHGDAGAEHAEAGHGADDHGSAGHGDAGHGAEEHQAASAGHADHGGADHGAAGIQGSPDDLFEIVLSPEANALKSIEVKLVAINSERKRFNIPLTKSPGKGDTSLYQAPASFLPGSGGYELEASLSGVTSKKEHLHVESEPLRYIKVAGVVTADEGEEHQLVVAEKEVVETFPVTGLLIVTVLNVLTAAGVTLYLKKVILGGMVELPSMPPIEPVKLALAGMRERLTLTTLDLNDPRFSGASEEIPPSSESAAPAESAEDDGTGGGE